MAEETERIWAQTEAELAQVAAHVETQGKAFSDWFRGAAAKLQALQRETVRNSESVDKIVRQYEQDHPSILEQTGWPCGFFQFPPAGRRFFFNPTAVEFNGARWLIARDAYVETNRPPPFNTVSQLTAFQLVNDRIHGPGRVIQLPKGPTKQEQWEDPRVLWSGHQLWLSACNFVQAKTGAHQAFAILSPEFHPLNILHPVYGKNGPAIHLNKGHEKNWLWFKHDDGHPYMVYQNNPHVVVKMDKSVQPMEQWETGLPAGADIWQHFERRGGTNPVRIGDEYWSFFHSSTPWWNGRRRYYMGAYAFEAKPPFRVTRMTPRPLLSGSLRDPKQSDFPVVVFPGGDIWEEATRSHFVVMGVNDCHCAWIRIPHADLESICIDVHNENKRARAHGPAKHSRTKRAASKGDSKGGGDGVCPLCGVEAAGGGGDGKRANPKRAAVSKNAPSPARGGPVKGLPGKGRGQRVP